MSPNAYIYAGNFIFTFAIFGLFFLYFLKKRKDEPTFTPLFLLIVFLETITSLSVLLAVPAAFTLVLRAISLALVAFLYSQWRFLTNWPVQAQLDKMEQQLGLHIDARYQAEQELRIHKRNLNSLVQIRTQQLNKEINERKRVEKELKEAYNRVEQMANLKQDFFSTISHELRTPINAVIGITELMKNNPGEQQEEYLETLSFSSRSLLMLVNDILDLAKLESGKFQFEHITFNTRKVINQVISSFRFKVEEKHLRLPYFVDPALPDYLAGDPNRLTQILNNLLSNAIKFTNEGFVYLQVVAIETKENQAVVRFIVEDTGTGIEQDKVDQVFETYTQAEAKTSRKFGGTGLGLSICKNLIEAQQGNINVSSQKGQGTTFSVTLPFSRPQPESVTATPLVKEEDLSLKGVRFLLVEDDDANRIVASNMLQQFDASFQIAENGRKAVELVQANRFDVVLMDLNMPVMNGMEALSIIRNSRQHHHLPVIATTADNLSHNRDELLANGFNEIVIKPYNSGQLYRSVVKCLKMNTPVPAGHEEDFPEPYLNHLLNTYGNDRSFIHSLLKSMRKSFNELPQQLMEGIGNEDEHYLRSVIHKIRSSVNLLKNEELNNLLNNLHELVLEHKFNQDHLIGPLLHQISCQCEWVIEKIDGYENKIAQD